MDLDDFAGKLGSHISRWQTVASVGALTWRDEIASWPQPILTDRDAVEVPESVGLVVTAGQGQRAARRGLDGRLG